MNDADRAQLTLLLADDEPENVRAYARALRGYNVMQATRGDEALALVAEHPIDIIVTDQRMPGVTGASLLQRARAVNPIVRRVVVSASAVPEELLEAINRGEVERYLVKPVDAEKLRKVVDDLAEQYVRMRAQRDRIIELQDQLQALRRDGVGPDEGELLERVELELVRCNRYHRPLTLIVFDPAPHVDMRRVREVLRELDIALRVGARLLIALPESDLDGANVVWERLRSLMPDSVPFFRECPKDGVRLQSLLLSQPFR
ncbi:MAG: response regulator [Polyangia bacterium]